MPTKKSEPPTGEISGTRFSIPNTVTTTYQPTTTSRLTVTASGKTINTATSEKVEKLRTFLRSRLHSEWTPSQLAEAETLIDEIKQSL